MNDQELLDVLLREGQVLRFFKLCATSNVSPIDLRFHGFNVVSALLLSPRSPEEKVDDFAAVQGGYPSLTRNVLSQLLDEPVWWSLPGQNKPIWIHPLRYLAQTASTSDFQVLFALVRSKGYQPSNEIQDIIDQDWQARKEQGATEAINPGPNFLN